MVPVGVVVMFALFGAEMLTYYVRPTWLGALAFLPAEPAVRPTLRSPRSPSDEGATYRELGRAHPPLPQLRAKTQLTDAVLVTRGTAAAVRCTGSDRDRQSWLYAIRIESARGEVVLRARQVWFGWTMPLGIVAVLATTRAPWGTFAVPVVFAAMTLATQRFGAYEKRSKALAEAYVVLEREIRAAVGERE